MSSSSWGGPGEGYDWPTSNHGITVDHMDNVWIGGNDVKDAHILKFTRAGQFLLQLGKPRQNEGSNDPVNFWRVAKISIDADANEAYVADGYGNKRVVVLDVTTGERKRYWGAYGNAPDDTDLGAVRSRRAAGAAVPQSRALRGAVARRLRLRLRPRQRSHSGVPQGRHVRQRAAGRAARRAARGSVWDIAFSQDPEQTYIYLADGAQRAHLHHRSRKSMQILTSFGDGGRQPGQFFGVHSIATDSQGNIYTTETYEGKRVQKFVYRGLAPIDSAYQGVVWPNSHND